MASAEAEARRVWRFPWQWWPSTPPIRGIRRASHLCRAVCNYLYGDGWPRRRSWPRRRIPPANPAKSRTGLQPVRVRLACRAGRDGPDDRRCASAASPFQTASRGESGDSPRLANGFVAILARGAPRRPGKRPNPRAISTSPLPGGCAKGARFCQIWSHLRHD